MPKLVQSQLTVRGVTALNTPGHYADGRSLYLYVSPNGHKSWVLRYTLGGRRRDMGLGPVHRVSLADARKRAATAYTLIDQQIDPIDERKNRIASLSRSAEVKRVRFEEALDTYLRTVATELKGKHATNTISPIYTYVVPVLGKLPIADISTKQVAEALTNKVNGKSIWEMAKASYILTHITKTFAFAIREGWRENPNPAERDQLKWAGLALQKREVEHHPACPYTRVHEYWEQLQTHTDISMMCLRWIILNAARPGEARLLRWEWISTKEKEVTIPASEMKNGVAHKIPYSEASAALLERMRTIHNGALVFPSKYDKPYGEYIFSKITKQVVPGMTDITAHGFRSTFSTWVDEETDFGPDVREVALSHTVGTKAAQAYARGKLLKKRRTMMEFWATYCLTGKIDPRCRSSFVDAAD